MSRRLRDTGFGALLIVATAVAWGGCRLLIGATDLQPVSAEAGPSGSRPGLLPPRMLVGLQDNDGVWMGSSGVRWDVRWAYFTANAGTGWYNNYGYGNNGSGLETPQGSWALGWLQEVDRQGFVPAIQYYCLQPDYGNASGAADLTALQNGSRMGDYFTKFKLLLQVSQLFAKPVIVILEGNVFGAVETAASNNPGTPAAIASSGVPELANLPDTVAGFGLAFLTLRQTLGATNVIMGPDVPAQDANGDFINYAITDDIGAAVAYQYGQFFNHLGVGANVTGSTFDFVASAPAFADADLYAAQGDTRRWWDDSDTATVGTRSYARYASWLSSFNRASRTPWLLWQLPMGNSNSPDVPNLGGAWAGPYDSGAVVPASCRPGADAGCPGGYKDNRPEYFFGAGSQRHLATFAAAGVFGLLFGAGESGASDQTDDYYNDGQLFMKSRAGALLNGGGFPLGP